MPQDDGPVPHRETSEAARTAQSAAARNGAWDRRSVLLGGATLLGGASVVAGIAGCPPDEKPYDGKSPKPNEGVPPEGEMGVAEVMPILIAVADQLLPEDETGPGVKSAGIETYLEKTLADPRMKAIKSLVTRGAVFLGRASRKEHGKGFWELTAEQRENFIGRLARNEVRPNGFTPQAFVRVMLALTLECFLGDPRHGGNKNEVGWKFVGGINWAGR